LEQKAQLDWRSSCSFVISSEGIRDGLYRTTHVSSQFRCRSFRHCEEQSLSRFAAKADEAISKNTRDFLVSLAVNYLEGQW
jgi:hypothetical protein